MNAAARTGFCSCSGRHHITPATLPRRNAPIYETPGMPPLAAVGSLTRYRVRPVRVTNEGQEMSDPENEKFEKEYMNLGPQWQIPNPEAGPLEQRVQTTFVDGLLSGDIVEEDSEYWFTEPPGGWNQEDKILRKAIEVPLTYPTGLHEGPGGRGLSEFKEGMVLTGKVEAIYFHHGIKVDIGGVYDGLIAAWVEQEAWENLAGAFQIDMEVKVRVYRIFTGPRCRFPIQLELLEPAELQSKLKPPEEYYPSFDLRDLSTVEELEWATGMDVTGGKEFELNVFDRDRLRDRMSDVASVKAIEGWEEQFEHGLPPPPDGAFSTGSLLDEFVSRQGLAGTVIIPHDSSFE